MNVAYKHLDSKLRIAELTLGQWAGVVVGLLIAVVFAFQLHPFGTSLTLITAVYLGGLPVCAAFMASLSDFDLWLLVRSCVRWRRADGRYRPGAGAVTHGYRLSESMNELLRAERARSAQLDLRALWDER